jgi:nitrate/nitrite-specific signal transduction histidine kinase
MTEKNDEKSGFFAKFFEEGKAHIEGLLKQNEQLQKQVALLRHELSQNPGGSREAETDENSELASVCQERDRLAQDLRDFKKRMQDLERENADFAEKYLQVEKESSNLASLYVASYQLHSSLDYDVVLQRINEILINLIGAERFAVYLYDPKTNSFNLVSGEGVEERKGSKIPLADNFLSRIARSGELYLAQEVTSMGDDDRPIAALPLVAEDELLGLLVIYKLLIQKDSFEPIDHELFDLLAGHAAIAVRAAQMHARSERKAATLEGFLQMLKEVSTPENTTEES